MSVTSDGSTIIPRTRGREECVAHRRPWSATTRFRHRPGGSPRHKPKLGLTVNFTPATRLDVPESQLGSRTGLSTPDLSHARIQGADLLEEWVARLAGHRPGVGQRDAG